MAYFFWSDTHFGHTKIISYCPTTRPFATVEEMDAKLIERWNEKVKDSDEIFFLGDFSFAKDPSIVFNQLKGIKHLVKGNHDNEKKATLGLPWASVSDILEIKQDKILFVCCHFPLESWNKMHRGSYMLHGHQHGTGTTKPKRFDVGVDVWQYPVSFDMLIEIGKDQIFEPVDHHTERRLPNG